MAKPLSLHGEKGQPVFGQQPRMALSSTHSFMRRQTGRGPRQMWIPIERGQGLIMEELIPLIHNKLVNVRAAFKAMDPEGTGLVSKNDFRQVLKSLMYFSQNQLEDLLREVCDEHGETVDYVYFLRRFSRGPTATRTSSSISTSRHSSDVRHGPKNTSMSLPEIQKHLKHKIGGNLRTLLRAFRLFDHNREGHIEQHEFRRILDNYCIQLTNKEFQRLWHHYSPNNMIKISYELFLDKLGFGEGHNFKIAPVCTKLVVSCPETNQKKRRSESQASFCDAPSALSHRNLQTLFYDKMCMNSVPVWQALQAFDTTCSGLVKQGVLRAVLSSFIFPMDLHSFQKLTSRYGVRATGLIKWKQFLSHFMSQGKENEDTKPHIVRTCEQSAPDGENFNFEDIYPQLRDIFYVLDVKEGGRITRADLRHLLQRPLGTHPQITHCCLHHSRITELFNVLDPEHTGFIQLASLERLNPSITVDTAPTLSHDNAVEPLGICEEIKDTRADREEQKTSDERKTTQWANKVSSASWRTIKSLQAGLEQFDPQHTGYIMEEDLKKVLNCSDVPVADMHFNKLCDSFRTGTSSTMVSYTDLFNNLGVPIAEQRNISSYHGTTCHTERTCKSPQSVQKPVLGERPLSSTQVSTQTCNILDIVFQRMKSRLEQRHTSLTVRIQAIIPNPETVDLTEADLWKILEDSWVVMDKENFNEFAKCLGVMDGRIRRSVFQAKYEEATGSAREQLDSESGDGEKKKLGPLLTSPEQCLAALKTRIMFIHGNTLAAFRLMDRQCKGVVDCHDFKVLYNTLGFFCSKAEYKRLLDLIGLHPGGNLNYAEFAKVVENNGKGALTINIQDQLHELLASEAHYKWADMSKVLCQFDADGHSRIDKKSLRRLLFTYALPIGPSEFDQLWSRYDTEGRGSVAVCDFLEKLGFHHGGDLKSQSRKQYQTVSESTETASLAHMKQILQENHKDLSEALTNLDSRRDGTVMMEELLSLLHSYGCYISREQFMHHLQRLSVSTYDDSKRLSYKDLLSEFDSKAENKSQPPTPVAVHQIELLDSLGPDVALAKMRERVTSSAPNLYKAFSAFDQGGKGTVKALEFRRVLESFCARPSEKQYRHLLTKLELDCEKSTVNWKDFLNKFQISDRAQSGSREKESKPSSLVQTELPQQSPEVVSGHQIKLTKELMDQDTSSAVSKKQFQQLFERHCPDLRNDQFECVWRQMPATEQRKLQDREFEKLGRTQSARQSTSRHPASVGRPGTGSPPGSMERRLRGALQRCWKEIQRKCAAEDSQREGHISTSSFLGILQSLNISITQEQLENLAVKFGFMNNGFVLYNTFFQHFLLNLNPAETTKAFERLKLPLPSTQTSQGVLTKGCVEVMLRTYNVIRPSWTSIRRSFLTSDLTRTGSVSVQDFRKVLCRFGVKLSEEEFFHLCSYFDAKTTGKICYDNFLWVFLR